jgi:hypothetical protein
MIDTLGTPVPWPLLRGPQTSFRSIDAERLVFPAIDVLSSVSNFDLTRTRIYELYTAPINKLGFVLGIYVQAVVATNVTVVPQISVGIASGEDDIFPVENLATFNAVGDTWSNWLVMSKARASKQNQSVKINITGATADKLLAHVYLLGFEH